MNSRKNKTRPFAIFIVSIFLAGQILLPMAAMLYPKPAKAFLGLGDFTFTTETWNLYDIAKDIGLGALKRISLNFANQYLTRFAEKVLDKYRIRNYLYYGQSLANYYLHQYIREKITDPDLRGIYTLLETDMLSRMQVTTVTPQGQRQRQALLKALDQKINKYYIEAGGISSSLIYNPPPELSNIDYYAAAQSYWLSPPEVTAQSFAAYFEQMQAASRAAADQEIAQGKGNKSGRGCNPLAQQSLAPASKFLAASGLVRVASAQELPSTPIVPPGTTVPLPAVPPSNPQPSAATSPSTAACIISAIQNPGSFIEGLTASAFDRIFANNYNPDSVSSQIGSLLGNFIFRKLNLDKSNDSGVLSEYPGTAYAADSGASLSSLNKIDSDGDGFPEGIDYNLDGKPDNCFHGGVAPNCVNSSAVTSSAYFTPLCIGMETAVAELKDFAAFLSNHADQLEGGAALKGIFIGTIWDRPGPIVVPERSSGTTDNFIMKADAKLWNNRAILVQNQIQNFLGAVRDYRNPKFDDLEISVNRYASFMERTIASLAKDGDLDLARRGSGGGGLENLMKNTANITQYLARFQKELGRCDRPNVDAAAQVPLPDITDVEGTESECAQPYSFILAEDGQPPRYQAAVIEANRQAIAENPPLADSDRSDEGAGEQLLEIVAEKLRAQGYVAGWATNCNNNDHPDENLMVYRGATATYGEFFSLYRVEAGITYQQAAERRGYALHVGFGSVNMCKGCR